VQEAPEILIVDDNPADVVLVRESLAETAHQSHVHCVADAGEAIAYLRQQGRYSSAVRPDLVILDLNLVRRDGHTVLTALKSRGDLRQIPVVVFSSSGSLGDITRSYTLGANCYINKPAELKRFFSVVRAIEEFWFGYASLPQKENDERRSYARVAD
jgi:CheY-like chemotaxis protein